MPVTHKYLNASDNIAQYMADQCGRQAITVAEYFADDRLADLTVYRFSAANYEDGFDPWSIVTLDRYVEGREPDQRKPYIMERADGLRHVDCAGDKVVFVSKKALAAAGIKVEG